MATPPHAPYYSKKAHHANRLVIFLQGKPVGLIQDLRVGEDYGAENIYAVGAIAPQEIVPSAARYSLSMSIAVLKNQNMYSVSTGPGGTTTAPEDSQGELYFVPYDVTVVDSDNNAPGRSWFMCYYSSGDLSITMNRYVMQSAVFLAQSTSGNLQTYAS